jgi:hypothetical protein
VCGRKTVREEWHGECKEKEGELTFSSDCACKDGLPHGRGWMLETGEKKK